MINHIYILIVILYPLYMGWDSSDLVRVTNHRLKQEATITQKAFDILKAKCNSCHMTEYERKVFTIENMSKSAKAIHKQVFLKKKMPKGDQIKLTEKEYKVLKEWLLELGVE